MSSASKTRCGNVFNARSGTTAFPSFERILRILGAAEGRRLKRSQLTQKLSDLGCTRDERRIEALRQLETAGVIRRETFQVREESVQQGEIWVLEKPQP
jgi:hypothetical protein